MPNRAGWFVSEELGSSQTDCRSIWMLSMSNSLLRLAKLSAVNVMLLSYQEPGPS
jgi:hypothetical protein